MKRYAYLIKVEPNANNNKFYEMKEDENGTTFTAYYGRVGSSSQVSTYPISRWNSIYNQKLSDRKGYTDITHLKAKETGSVSETKDRLDTNSRIVRDIFTFLLAATKENVAKNYLMPVSGVTEAMILEAQSILDGLVSCYDSQSWDKFNRYLLDLFVVLPRNMRRVGDYLLTDDHYAISNAAKIISSEQDTLDSLKGQIVVSQDSDTKTASESLFDTLGISVSDVTSQDEQLIKTQLTDISNMYHQAIRIRNIKTETRYRAWLETKSDQTEMFLWHGSRNQNWVSLMEKGLLLHPTGAIITGKMFGYGLYFAPRAKKSLGYTSHNGSHWANGNSNRGYMALYQVHTGKMKRYQTSQGSLNYDKVSGMGYDSVMGEKGISLYNDEIIVYNEAQTNIQFLVELRGR